MKIESDLFRAVRTKYFKKTKDRGKREEKFRTAQGGKSLYPHMGDLDKGGTRAPDVTMVNIDGSIFVVGYEDEDGSGNKVLQNNEGVSVTGTFGTMGGLGWCYFLLPNDTEIPVSLDIVEDPLDSDPKHHLVRLRNRMRLDAYQGALDNLARNAIVEAMKQGRSIINYI